MERQNNFSKLWELLFITANQIAYPQNAPANLPQKRPPTQKTKYPIWDWRRLTDNNGWLPIKIDYANFKQKKYYSDAQEEVLQKHLEALEKKQTLLKNFKHHQDFDRIDYQAAQNSNTFQNQIQKLFIAHIVSMAIFSRILVVASYTHHFSFTLWKKTFKNAYFATLPIPIIANLFYQQANPVNHQYFRSNTKEARMYEAFAYDLDAYQKVNDIKYSYKYPERNEFNKTIWEIYSKKTANQYEDSIKYYKRVYGIVDPEPFWSQSGDKLSKQKNEN